MKRFNHSNDATIYSSAYYEYIKEDVGKQYRQVGTNSTKAMAAITKSKKIY